MEIPPPQELLARIGELPAAAALERLLGGTSFTVALVGGAVRDLLIGAVPADLDLVVEGPLDTLVEHSGGELRSHERFGTKQLMVDGHRLDLAAARRESYASPGALPVVEPASLQIDLGRRDFTVNALAIPLNGPAAGALVVVPGALEDLEERRLRVLHPRSFVDDPTRLLRLARYAARLGFTPELTTLRLAADAILAGALATVSGTRIGNELRLLASEPDPVRALAALRELGIDRAIHPAFGLTDDAWAARAIELLGAGGRKDRLALGLAVRRLSPIEAGELLSRFAFTAEDRTAIVDAAAGVARLSDAIAAAERPSELAVAVAGASPEAIALAGALGPARAAERWLSELRHVPLAVDGGDLLDAGVPAGPAIGRGLRAAWAAALDGVAPDRAAQLAIAVRAASDRGDAAGVDR